MTEVMPFYKTAVEGFFIKLGTALAVPQNAAKIAGL
jgi:hypothetical protein